MTLMKNFSLFIFLLMLPFQALEAQELWFKIDKVHQGFSAFFPERPSEATNSMDTEIGMIEQEIFYLNNEEGPVYFFQINYIEYPESTIHSDSLELMEEFFEETINTATAEMKGTLVYSSDIEEQGFKGKMYRIDYKADRFTLKAKTFVVRNRYYSVQVIHEKGKDYRVVDRFLDGFRIIPVQDN